eukprot:1321907-Pleurochrysis_carterae.AAC.2
MRNKHVVAVLSREWQKGEVREMVKIERENERAGLRTCVCVRAREERVGREREKERIKLVVSTDTLAAACSKSSLSSRRRLCLLRLVRFCPPSLHRRSDEAAQIFTKYARITT